MATVSVDIEKFLHRMRALNEVLKRPLRDVVNSGARVCAISLAKSTQPSRKGDQTGAGVKEMGEKAVARDIHRVYGNAGDAYQRIRNPRLKGAFWAHYKKHDYEKATEVARNADVQVSDFDGGSAHRAELRSRRPVITLSSPKLYIIKPRERQKLKKYIKFQQAKVGTAKGGWVDCVRVLGGTPRGLKQDNDITANWITRHGRGYGAAVKGGSDFDPTVVITNRIPYVRSLLSKSAEQYAKGIAHDRMIQNLEYAVKAQARKI